MLLGTDLYIDATLITCARFVPARYGSATFIAIYIHIYMYILSPTSQLKHRYSGFSQFVLMSWHFMGS